MATDAGDVRARVVVGADGLNSRVRRLAGLQTPRRGHRFGVAAHIRPNTAPEPFVDISVENGYEVYLTPVGDGLLNAALLTSRSTMRAFAGDLAGRYAELLRSHPALAAGFEVVDEPVAAGPFPAAARRAFQANVVLVGDAAGFFDGITGEGMSAALVSARFCADAVHAYVDGAGVGAFRTYDVQRRALVRNANLVGRLSLALASHPALARRAVRNLGRRPETFERLARISAGEMGLRALRPRDALAMFAGR